ncbi:EF-hand and coiled-coil domain-containing protein 1-like isoform X2 [Sinocyclocheilus rhinocerous]|uniref:EF-hand and coiled-coil domain-containing protein 1-like isoform X2 n=1 Tax=Sinocyclocheilus rhinocerous TaxID=307959 RepID=UPI0007B920DF|nr:PREDICTED: EF-hand and coiled-coil domain-containing protein 1-like isoform X2 [Sinocyclocheilus rhinocerous]
MQVSRKSEWLKSALAHHFGPESDPYVENEIVVLATGVDQYLQEVFHHLALYNGDDLVSDEDFRSLCLILGFPANAETENGTSEHRDICDGLPHVLNFREFHARLCGFFSLKAQEGQKGVRLPVSEETEHIEREIRHRCPRVRRRKCVSFDLSADHQNRKRAVRRSGPSQNPDHLQSSAVEAKRNAVDINPQRRWQDQLELENGSLRELVEDLRSALQSSDARCLALEVALRRRDMPFQNTAGGTPETQNCKTQPQQSKHMEWDSRRSTKDLLRELELIRASRDGQLEEAMRFNQRLEEELMAAYGEISRMQEMLDSVRTENTRIKKRTEEVRESLAAGLQGVRALQEQAQQADLLREQVQSLESQLEKFRAQCNCAELNMNKTEILAEPCGSGFSSPASHDDGRREDLQRSVEGRAASDEEEEEKGMDEGQCCHLEVKRLINRLHSCAKGCQKAAICNWLVSQSSAHSKEPKARVWISSQADARGNEAGKMKQKEVESLRVYHSLLEERLTDTLTLLLQIPHKRVSRRILGKILINTLDLCTRKSHDCTPVVQVVDTLCRQLLSSDLLDGGEEVSVGSRPSVTSGHRNTSKPLLMSC